MELRRFPYDHLSGEGKHRGPDDGQCVVHPVVGALLKVGAPIYTYFLITYLPKATSPVVSFLVVAVSFIFLAGHTSINAILKSELFPVHPRALGVGLGYAVANSAFGRTAPLIYEALNKANQIPAYIMVLTGISLLVYIVALRNKSSTYLDHGQGYADKNSLPESHILS